MKTTDFGYQQVPEEEKARRVGAVFDSVSSRYDLMNDLMSFGLHRLWKRFALARLRLRPGERVLDLAGGSGDIAHLCAREVVRAGHAAGEVWLTDINASMLRVGRDRLLDAGLPIQVLQCDAEKLPFRSAYFDCVTTAFGLRNMTHKEPALTEMLRVLRPGGRAAVLEFSKIWQPLRPAYDAYSFNVVPLLGKLVAKDEASYRYLAESIRMHPSQDELKAMFERVGFERVEYHNLSAGIVALHLGYKF